MMSRSWIVRNGPYQDYINGLYVSDPRLTQPDPKPHKAGITWENRKVNIRTVESGDSPSDKARMSTLSGPDSLAQHLARENKPRHTVYIFENMNKDVATVLGNRFRMHPSLFTNYERIATPSSMDGSPSSMLASNLTTQECLCLSYRILVTLPSAMSYVSLGCSVTRRTVTVTRVNGKFDGIGTAKRKCCIWNEIREDGWTSIVICDPTLQSVIITDEGDTKGKAFPVGKQPVAGGYVDFLPTGVEIRAQPGPPTTSIADDLCFYLTNCSSLPGLSWETPDIVAIFVKKIIASLYSRHIEQLRKTIIQSQMPMRRHTDFTGLNLAAVETNWSDCQTLERRLHQYCLDLEDILIQLRLPFEAPDPRQITSWQDVGADFQMLYHQFDHARNWVEKFNSSMTALTGIAGNRQAFREQQLSLEAADRTRNITMLGLVFVPLAYVASLFSMSDGYAPGEEKFWLYLVISIPMMFIVLGVYQGIYWIRKSGRGRSIPSYGYVKIGSACERITG